jgi:DNA-binding GntR family transcriptional regulator
MFRTKQDEVTEIVRERIISGRYPSGTQLKQLDIAAELGVSVTPVREALHVLVAEGYVQSISHKGLIVPYHTLESARETLELRLLLERDLTERALPRLTRDDLRDLRRHQTLLMKAMEEGDLTAVRTENYRFHFCLYEAADRPQALSFVRILWAKYPFMAREHQERRTEQAGEHEAFLRHAEAGEHEKAVEAMVLHIRNGWENLVRKMDLQPASSRVL